MGNIFALIVGMLPSLIQGAAAVSADIAGHQKKAAVTHALQSAAQIASAASPEHAVAANLAASVAESAIDGMVALLREIGTIPPAAAAAVAGS
jgi:hypothetical protein